jgi:hypothetical protein
MIDKIWATIKRDYWYICIVLVVLGIALYALATIKDYENQCNEHWLNEMQHCNCACIQRPADPWEMPNMTFPIIYGGEQDG